MELELTQDLKFTRREWRVQRVAWVAFGVILLAALLGVFGPGPISSDEVSSDGGGLTVTYQRFNRKGAQNAVDVSVEPELLAGGQVELRLDRTWLSDVEVERITPQPSSTVVERDAIVYTFEVLTPEEPATISFDGTVAGLGPATGHVAAGAEQATFRQMFYP